MAELPLTQGYVTLVDDDLFDHLSQWKWTMVSSVKPRSPIYAYRRRRAHEPGTGRHIRLHRFIMGVTDRNVVVDHINRNTLDNRRANLRLATPSQNGANRLAFSGSYKGVVWMKDRSSWSAQIQVDRKRLTLGTTFASAEEAARAYDAAAVELYGLFACLNFPSENTDR